MVIIVVIVVVIDDHSCMSIPVAASMIIIMITCIDAPCHNGEGCIIGGIIAVIIGWIIRYIHRGIHILDDGCGFDDNYLCRGRCTDRHRVIASVAGVGCTGWCGGGLRFDDVIFAIELFVTYYLHGDFSLFILGYQNDGYILCFLFADGDLEDKAEIISFLLRYYLDKVNLFI